MKKIISVSVALLILASCFPLFASAVDTHLFDYADLLTDEEEEQIESALAEVSEKIGMDVLLYTVDGLDGKSAKDYADDTMDYEYGDVEDGVLLLISMEDRDWAFSAKGKGEKVFTYEVFGSVEDDILPDLKDNDFFAAFSAYADSILKTYKRETAVFHFTLVSIGVPVVVGIIIAAVIVGMMKSQLKSARFHNAGIYLKQGSLNLVQKTDLFLYTTVTRTKIQSESSSGGGSHTSSSGSSHSGRSGKF